jgi:hypothetical protein
MRTAAIHCGYFSTVHKASPQPNEFDVASVAECQRDGFFTLLSRLLAAAYPQ